MIKPTRILNRPKVRLIDWGVAEIPKKQVGMFVAADYKGLLRIIETLHKYLNQLPSQQSSPQSSPQPSPQSSQEESSPQILTPLAGDAFAVKLFAKFM